jgi:hypothetical protein
MANSKITALPAQAGTILGTDIFPMIDDPGGASETQKATFTQLQSSFAATAAQVTTGTSAVLNVTPDALAGSDYGKHLIMVDLCGAGTMAITDIVYVPIKSIMNGWNLIEVSGNCKTNTTGPTITVKNGATSMLTTNLTFDNTHLTTVTASVPAVIDTAHDHVATDDWLEIKCSVAGSGVTYCVISLVFQLP